MPKKKKKKLSKKKYQELLAELRRNNKWEQVHYEKDRMAVRKRDRANNRSGTFMALGLAGGVAVISSISTIFNEMVNGVPKDYDGKLTFAQLTAGIETSSVVMLVFLALLTAFFFIRAMFYWDEAENLETSRYIWYPEKEEVTYIEQRFDTPLVQTILSHLSATSTKMVEVKMNEVIITADDKKSVCNFNRCGYATITNYDTKQLAYYLAVKAFPAGFSIYQSKVALSGTNLGTDGLTEGTQPVKIKKSKRFKRMLTWLTNRFMERFRLKASFNISPLMEGPSPVNNGQIIINKGFQHKTEGLKTL